MKLLIVDDEPIIVRGLLQLTGRANYQAYARSRFCNGDLMSHPDWLAHLPGAVKSAMWYWWSRSLNTVADNDDILVIKLTYVILVIVDTIVIGKPKHDTALLVARE